MVKLNRIYTRTGDAGTTGLVDGSRVPKSSGLIAAIGEVDEANSAIGLAVLHADDPAPLLRIQNDLFDLGADLATPARMDGALRILPDQVARLEREIDAMTAQLTPLTSFVLPGGTPLAAALHLARAVTRRAERAASAADVSPPALAYLNRLSDWLFCAARLANDCGEADILWRPGATR
jgi:cob(I)alamin adenosyltransferase